MYVNCYLKLACSKIVETCRPLRVLKEQLNGVMSVAVNDEYLYWTTTKRELHFEKGNQTFVIQLPGHDKGVVSRKVTYASLQSTTGTCFSFK